MLGGDEEGSYYLGFVLFCFLVKSKGRKCGLVIRDELLVKVPGQMLSLIAVD